MRQYVDFSNLKRDEKFSIYKSKKTYNSIRFNWGGSVLRKESTLHQIAPYIGKMKSSMANTLIANFTKKSETLYDPFCGSGSVALEAWAASRNIIANDLSIYAVTLTRAKLFPIFSLDKAIDEIDKIEEQVQLLISRIDLRRIPRWVRAFFHPETLREVIAWAQVLNSKQSYFLLSCLLGILHHQRPGFLSYPSSHTVPYLRDKKFKREIYPDLYNYRSVKDRLVRKAERALKRIPELDYRISRKCIMNDASRFIPENKVNAILTSPPYMKQLDYGRDNRLRLWFLGISDWKSLDRIISPPEKKFINLFSNCLNLWHNVVNYKGLLILVLGDTMVKTYDMPLSEVVAHIATIEVGGYSVVCSYSEQIPDTRRVRRGKSGSLKETILVLRNEKG